MKKTFINLTILLTFGVLTSFAQNIGINGTGANAHPSALLDLDASPTNNTGFAMPRLTTAQRLAIASPVNGLQVYDTDLNDYYYFNTTSNKWDCVSVRAGTVTYFANATAPIGYLICDGSLYSTTTYPELFNAIGYLYGGSGATFQVPDLRGEFIRGAALTGTVDAGRVLGSSQPSSTVAYPNNASATVHIFSGNYSSFGTNSTTLGATNTEQPIIVSNSGLTVRSTTSSDINNGSTPTFVLAQIRPRNIALLPCIKY